MSTMIGSGIDGFDTAVEGNVSSQYTAPNLFIEASNGTTYAYRRFGKAGAPPCRAIRP